MTSDTDGTLSDKAAELTAGLLAETREELVKADSKASILLASVGVIIGVVLGGAVSGDWGPEKLACGAQVVWWLGVICAAIGIVAMGNAVYPRIVARAPGRITYFEDVHQHEDCDSLVRDLNTEARRGDRDAEQLLRLSNIAHRKYRSIQVGMWFFIAAAVLCAAAALFG
jgi:hypothetical protein